MKPRLFAVFFAGLMAGPLFARIDFSGYWNNPMQEDQPERGGGLLSGEYIGIR